MDQVLRYIDRNKDRFLQELKRLIAIPSVSTNPEYKQDIKRCAQWIADHLSLIGMEKTKIYPTKGNPIIYSDWLQASGKPTILFYGHYDVQPAEPLNRWTSPPFQATVRGQNLFGRGATDDKGQIFIHFKCIEAYLKTMGKLPINLKILLEGEEEIGGKNLSKFIEQQKKLLKADLVLISDTAFFAKGVPSICYGLRGNVFMRVELRGPNRDLHSGSFGGSIHNPIQALAAMIAQLHDADGHVAIAGFYDDVRQLTRLERDTYRKLPWNDKRYARDLGVKQLYGERGFTTLERLWTRPTLECNGIWGGHTGEEARGLLPQKASANISMRLVPDQNPKKIAKLFETHLRKLVPKTVSVAIRCLTMAEPTITAIDSPGVRVAVVALKMAFGKDPLFQRDGGSIPIVNRFKQILRLDSVLLGFGLPDANEHAPNEFINLGNFFRGIRTVAYFYDELPKYLKNRGKNDL
ncbi:MAG: dipeptidase [Ignavibacteriae bacterium]|nr:dipeptidase [Ignavibacteriota bacterium]